MLFICLCCLNESPVINCWHIVRNVAQKDPSWTAFCGVFFHVSHGYCCLPLNNSLYIYTSDLFHELCTCMSVWFGIVCCNIDFSISSSFTGRLSLHPSIHCVQPYIGYCLIVKEKRLNKYTYMYFVWIFC